MEHVKFKYITYEEPFVGKKFTEHLMKMVYKNRVDKAEYPNYDCWKEDMLKSGVFQRI